MSEKIDPTKPVRLSFKLNGDVDWDNDAAIARLTHLWAVEGWSASQIATEFRCSRNVIIGKVYRLGLGGRATPSAPKLTKPAPAPSVAARSVQRTLPRIAVANPAQPDPPRFATTGDPAAGAKPGQPIRTRAFEALPGTRPVPFGDQRAGQCKWPIGEDPVMACAEPAEGPYCTEHARLAYDGRRKPDSANELARSLRRYV